ncbi:MAG: AmmeMemoRadiSam system radical SAM enzyme [bacterium]
MTEFSRRTFLSGSVCAGCAFSIPSVLVSQAYGQETVAPGEPDDLFVHEARYYEHLDDKKVECHLCPKKCGVANQERGYCGVRENRDGTYYSLVYGRVCSMGRHDPIEKKPLFHYLPGTAAFSIATAGCNMECKFCQNWNISQFRPEQVQAVHLSPAMTAQASKNFGAPTIAYTYSEPVVFYEYMYDAAVEGRKLGIGSVMITNGYIEEQPLRDLCKVLTGIKVDFKAFTEKFYRETCSGELQPVLRTLKILAELKIWFELVVLIVPTLNDGIEENKSMVKWIRENLGDSVPVHFTRYHPTYKIKNIPSTPIATLERLWNMARDEGLKFAYLGNVTGHPGEDTYCPGCKEILIKRTGYYIGYNKIEDGKCPKCSAPIPGVWKDPLT